MQKLILCRRDVVLLLWLDEPFRSFSTLGCVSIISLESAWWVSVLGSCWHFWACRRCCGCSCQRWEAFEKSWQWWCFWSHHALWSGSVAAFEWGALDSVYNSAHSLLFVLSVGNPIFRIRSDLKSWSWICPCVSLEWRLPLRIVV